MLDHLRNSPSVNLDDLDVLVLDEADRLLDLGFQVIKKNLFLLALVVYFFSFSLLIHSHRRDELPLACQVSHHPISHIPFVVDHRKKSRN